MKYLAMLVLGMLLGALVHRELAILPSPAPKVRSDCLAVCVASTPEPVPGKLEAFLAPHVVTSASGSTTSQASPEADRSPSGLLIPVQGKTAHELVDTFTDARSEGRSHDAIDIMAAAGTPVLAVADGHVEKMFNSQRGGLTVYQFEPTGKYVYYYAHLQRYTDGLAEKQSVRRGQVIGYVGSTGNADPAAPHLHFAILLLGPERRWWKGTAINPYPYLSLINKAA